MNNDLISREALKEEVKTLFCPDGYKIMMLQRIDNAPTVELFKSMCKAKDEAICEEMTTDGHCNYSKPCPNKGEERPKGEVEITNEDIQQAIKEGFSNGYEMAKAKFSPKQGEWITDNLHNTICDNCGGIRRDNRVEHIAFCNKCGAKMKGGAE